MKSRLLLARSASLITFSPPPLDPEALAVKRHADCQHFAGLAAMTVNASLASPMQIESRSRIESLMATAALATIAGQTL